MTTIDAISSATRARRLPRVSALEGRYHLALLSMAAVDLVLSGVFLHLSGKLWLIALRLPEVAVILGLLTLAGGRVLFAPIRHFLETGEGEAAARERAARLGPLTTRWVIAVSLLFTAWAFFGAPFLVFGVEPSREVWAILVGRALAWAVLLPYVAFFAMQEYTRHLRRVLFDRHAMVVPPGRAKLGRKLALILLGGAIVPGASIAITLTLVPEISPITGQPRSVVILTTLAGAGIAIALAFWATQRSTTTALRTLLRGMRRVEKGDPGHAIPIDTDDELGRLGAGFNALTGALAEARETAARKETERAHAARQFHEAQKREALGCLAAGIAHDFNNILAIVMMQGAMARKRCADDPAAAKRLDEVLAAAGRGRDLISQILDFARDRPVDHAALDLTANLRETVDLIRETLARGVTVEADLPEDAITVCGDATGLHQVIANLMINAVHAMPGDGGHLHVGLRAVTLNGGRARGLRARQPETATSIAYERRDDGSSHAFLGILSAGAHAHLTVRDDGAGMAHATLERVFDPYFTTKPVGEGTGLGLAAVAGIVEAHGGGVHVATREGHGTRFDIFLPLTNDDDDDHTHEERTNG